MKSKFLPIVALLAIFISTSAARGGTLQVQPTVPGGPGGVQGNYVVGNTGTAGFLYNDVTKTHTTFQYQGNQTTGADGISGGLIVGGYLDSSIVELEHSYIYDTVAQSFTVLSDPSAAITGGFSNSAGIDNGTYANGINGNNVVGEYVDSSGHQHGFLYNIATQQYTTLDYPGATATTLAGISGNYIVGTYTQGNVFFTYPLLYDIATSTWSTFGTEGLIAYGIDGANIVGGTSGGGGNGWMYNINTTAMTYPLIGVQFPAGQVVESYQLHGISGNTLVGEYEYFNGRNNVNAGFVYRIPEPSTLILAALAALFLPLLARRIRGRDSPPR